MLLDTNTLHPLSNNGAVECTLRAVECTLRAVDTAFSIHSLYKFGAEHKTHACCTDDAFVERCDDGLLLVQTTFAYTNNSILQNKCA